MLNLYTFFHLNLAYSSLEEEKRAEVIKKCYWPLLRLARDPGAPLGIEASGYTLHAINRLDADWVAELRKLISAGKCEFVGSGYAQLIGPLVPAEVNTVNLKLGHQVYAELLGQRPEIALVNEQAYASGLTRHYLDAGYKAIVMEWDNPASKHREWSSDWRYYPQVACGQHGEEIPVIWNNSIAFQKFQRYAHGELSQTDYLNYLASHENGSRRCFLLYGNDVEIFDFRPGRYHTEARLSELSEWQRIADLFTKLQADSRFELVLPSRVLDLLDKPNAGNRLHLTSPEQPVVVKKQGKYNMTRWAVTGRADLEINTACWQIYSAFKKRQLVTDAHWRMLCYFWSSDFRTHITEKRWHKYVGELRRFCKEVVDEKSPVNGTLVLPAKDKRRPDVFVEQRDDAVIIETPRMKLQLNPRRGLAIDALWFKEVSTESLVRTLPHGYFDDISLGADFYSGHVVFEAPGVPKVTDLRSVKPLVNDSENTVEVTAVVETSLGPIRKTVSVSKDEARVNLHYQIDWPACPMGMLRLGAVTLNPENFDRATLYYSTHNGGYRPETFRLAGTTFDHGQPVSGLVSANAGVGLTAGWVAIGDAQKGIRVIVDQSRAATIGLVAYKELQDTYFFRLWFSAQELDETRRPGLGLPAEDANLRFSFAIEPFPG